MLSLTDDVIPAVKLMGEWRNIVKSNKNIQDEFTRCLSFLVNQSKEAICPEPSKIFRAFELCQPSNVRVVLVGQDPYPRRNDASGLAYSVESGSLSQAKPLVNISAALVQCGYGELVNGNLTHWAHQGIMMLNMSLTTLEGVSKAPGHDIWQGFVSTIITYIANNIPNVTYVAWGDISKKFLTSALSATNVDKTKVLLFRHPSPAADKMAQLSFSSCKHFVQINDYLQSIDLAPIAWINDKLSKVSKEEEKRMQLVEASKRYAGAVENAPPDTLCIYFTDGACTGNGKLINGVSIAKAAWSYHCTYGPATGVKDAGIVDATPRNVPTNNRGELMAIMKVLTFHLNNHPGRNIIIFSDSTYSINAVNVWYDDWCKEGPSELLGKANLDLIIEIKSIINQLADKSVGVKLAHVPAHSPYPTDPTLLDVWTGNNTADKLATELLAYS